jgi:5-methylcytosine-specific restriction endonuclease McrA
VKPINPKRCEVCTALFVGKSGQRLCSRPCRNIWLIAENAKGPKKSIATAVCQGCRNPFKPRVSRYATFCSRECSFYVATQGALVKAQAKAKEKIAALPSCKCGKRLARMDARWCSNKCRWLGTSTPRHDGNILASCRQCGNDFPIKARHRGRVPVYCSKSCSRKAMRRIDRANGTTRRASCVRGKRLRDATVERVNPFKVFERDGWQCWLCGIGCVQGACVPDSMAPTIDHVIPLAKGGEHSYANVRCAHFVCNSRKSDRIVERRGMPLANFGLS